MRASKGIGIIKEMNLPVFSNKDVALKLGVSAGAAAVMLSRLAADAHVLSLARGRWTLAGRQDPLEIGSWIVEPIPAYVSLQTALFRHGLISQIPETVYLISLARTQRIHTPISTYSLHHVSPHFFGGFELQGDKGSIRMATAEKALADFLYLAPAKTRLFRALPEITFTRSFSFAKVREWLEKITNPRTRTLAFRLLKEIRAKNQG